MTKKDMAKVESFITAVYEKSATSFGPVKYQTETCMTGCRSVVMEINKRRIRWPGHVLRMPQGSIPRKALRWTQPWKRKPGRPQTTWRRTVETDLREMDLTWGEAGKVAKNRDRWRRIGAALFLTRGEEDE